VYRILIEGDTDYTVATKSGLGGTKICFDALMADAIDFYPEYTGTGLLVLLQPDPKVAEAVSKEPQQTYQYVDKAFRKYYGVQWLKPIGFNNAYALMMRRQQAEKLDIHSISDLKAYLNAE
jgi:osmoprotectant transport system permease protein